MKIVTKKQLNLSQLIEWVWENEIKNLSCRRSNRRVFEYIWVNENSDIEFNEEMVFKKDDIFEFKIEEEITEDTVIPKLLTTFKKIYLKDDFGYQRVRIDEDFKIQLMLNKAEAHGEKIETLHMVNDDGTHTLLWRDGELID